jgi:hypothetical protein
MRHGRRWVGGCVGAGFGGMDMVIKMDMEVGWLPLSQDLGLKQGMYANMEALQSALLCSCRVILVWPLPHPLLLRTPC